VRAGAWRVPEAGWLALAAVLGLGLLAFREADSTRWDWQPGLAGTEPWRAWTAALLHWSPQHLRMNALGLLAVALLGWRAGAQPADALAWALAWPLTQAGLLLQPALQHYAGLSGVLHAGVAILACRLWRAAQGRARGMGAVLALGLLLKLGAEAPWVGATRAVPGWDFALAPGAHLSGAVAGLACALLCGRLGRSAA
jgi:rhomboid family GlyGly-CTERM serine protease